MKTVAPRPSVEATLTIRPSPLRMSEGSSSCDSVTCASRLIAKFRSQLAA